MNNTALLSARVMKMVMGISDQTSATWESKLWLFSRHAMTILEPLVVLKVLTLVVLKVLTMVLKVHIVQFDLGLNN